MIEDSNVYLDDCFSAACEGTLACSTCHVIFNAKEIDKLNLDEPSHEEVELLEKSYAGCTETSVSVNYIDLSLFVDSCFGEGVLPSHIIFISEQI